MSIMTKVQEALAANPGVNWNDLVLRRLRTATSSTNGALNDLWMRWFASQGYTAGSMSDRMAAYWRANNTPLAERNAFYFGYTAFFSGPVVTVPGAPTIGTATTGNAQATVSFTAPASDGGAAITTYRVTSTPGGITTTGATSPITITGLTNGTGYTFTVAAQNSAGFSAESAASNSVTPTNVTLALTNKTIASGGGSTNGVSLYRGGTMATFFNSANYTNVPGEWVASGATATIGDSYEVVGTVISGTDGGGTLNGTAVRLSVGQVNFSLTGTGSFGLIIRPFGGGSTLASATITIT